MTESLSTTDDLRVKACQVAMVRNFSAILQVEVVRSGRGLSRCRIESCPIQLCNASSLLNASATPEMIEMTSNALLLGAFCRPRSLGRLRSKHHERSNARRARR